MKPLRIYLENFMTHNVTDIDCTQFRSVLILGRYRNDFRKSMGIGKSNIFKAIEYVLFGETQIKLDKIIRHGCNKCVVKFEFEIGNKIYQIVRSRSRKSGKSDLRMYEKNEDIWVDITQKTPTETEYELAKIIKISHIAFKSSILFAQADLRGLASVSPRERKAMLKESLQISIYNKYEKAAKEKVSTTLKSVEKCKTIIESLGNPTDDLTNLFIQKSSLSSSIVNLQQEKVEIQTKLDDLRIYLIELQKNNISNIDEVQKELIKIQENRKTLIEKIKNITSNLEQNESRLEFNNLEIIKFKDIISKLEENRKLLIDNVLRSRVEVKDDISAMTLKEIDGKAYISRLKSDQTKLLRTIPDGDICEHCHQLVSKEHRQTCDDKRKEELELVNSNLIKYQKVLNNVKSKRSKFELELNEIENRESSLVNLDNKLSAKKSEVQQNVKLIKQLSETIELRKSELKNYFDNEETLKNQELLIKNKIEEENNDVIKSKIELNKTELSILNDKLKEIDNKISSLNVNFGMLEEKIIARSNDKIKLEEIQVDLSIKEKDLSMKLKVQQAFSSSGIPTMIINTILDDLQIVANDLLSEIRPDIEMVFLVAKTKADGQQEDTLDIVYRINNIEHEYDQLSGGQKVIIFLCLNMALSLIIQHRIGIDIKFLMLDEVDSQFDESALEAFIDVIKKWQDKFILFVVTHNKSLKDKFTHAILIEGDETNGSTGNLVTAW
jgi:DNA repair exonuclease SbcCD ATPase subunit